MKIHSANFATGNRRIMTSHALNQMHAFSSLPSPSADSGKLAPLDMGQRSPRSHRASRSRQRSSSPKEHQNASSEVRQRSVMAHFSERKYSAGHTKGLFHAIRSFQSFEFRKGLMQSFNLPFGYKKLLKVTCSRRISCECFGSIPTIHHSHSNHCFGAPLTTRPSSNHPVIVIGIITCFNSLPIQHAKHTP